MKKILNDPNQAVNDMLKGFTAAFPEEVTQLPETTVITKKDAPIKDKVGIVSGGGSGHEPAHAGYVGKGMLDAAVAGEVFTSPTPDQVLEAIKAVDAGKGVLLVIKNYSGDVINFDMAAEMAEAEGIEVESVIVKDDVAIENVEDRRGIAGTIFVHKVAGAKAEEGASLQEVKAAAEKTITNVRSMGMALDACTVPAAGTPSLELKENEMEIGVGIHGEPGLERKEIATADAIATELLETILNDMDFAGEVAVMVNGMGSTPEMELFIVNKTVQAILLEKNIHPHQTFVGEYMTALEMTGCSITVLKLDEELKKLLDAPSSAPAFRK